MSTQQKIVIVIVAIIMFVLCGCCNSDRDDNKDAKTTVQYIIQLHFGDHVDFNRIKVEHHIFNWRGHIVIYRLVTEVSNSPFDDYDYLLTVNTVKQDTIFLALQTIKSEPFDLNASEH